MGINLRDIIVAKEIKMEDLAGRKVGIDAYNWAYQFLSTIRLQTGELLRDSNGRITSHITGIFNRTLNLLKAGIKPCYVWDGKPPDFKNRTIGERILKKEEAQKAFEKAETDEEKKFYAQQTSRLTEEMIEDAEALLEAMGVPSIRAPSEGEAQVVHMVRSGKLWACASQDWDSLLFGTPLLIRNLSVTGKRKMPGKKFFITVNPELVDLQENLKSLGISQEQLIIMALLIGTDYNDGVKGFGPKRSLELIKKTKTLDRTLAEVKWDSETPAKELFEWFKKPETTDNYSLDWNQLDAEKVIKVLVDKHGFNQERVQSQIDSLKGTETKKGQTGLGKFF